MEKTILKTGKDSQGNKYVLCIIKKGTEYVTWACNEDVTEFYWGHYFRDLEPATADFEKRCANC